MLDLQRSAGNRAVSAMLARDPTDAGAAEATPMKDEKGATATLGLGDGIVIPIDSYTFRLGNNEVAVMFGMNAARPSSPRRHRGARASQPPSSRRGR